MSEPNSGSGNLLLRRVVSSSEEDRFDDEPTQSLRMAVSNDDDDDEFRNNAQAPSFVSSSAMGTNTDTAAAVGGTQQDAVWIESPPHNNNVTNINSDPRTNLPAASSGGVGGVVGTSSSAQALHLTDDSVKVPTKTVVFAAVPSDHLHRAAQQHMDRDLSSSSLSDDAEDDCGDIDNNNDNRDSSRGGLLRFVTAMVGSSKNSNNNSSSNNNNTHPRDVVTRSTDAQQSSAALDDDVNDGGGGGDARMRDYQDYGGGHGQGAGAAEDVSSTSAGEEEESTMERTGSQNSSRDWGWFEDVHMSLNEVTAGGLGLLPPPSKSNRSGRATSAAAAMAGTAAAASAEADPQGGRNRQQQDSNRPNNNNQQQQKPPKKKRGLVPQVSSGLQDYATAVKSQDTTDAAAAMAVTAPNYVLEESLSSQRLWKETAGQRPPQPAEERAFYEKMWAQNFERSNVEYGMPVEVLTATSPISLSPYFDAHYAAGDPDHDPHHHHHHHDVDYATAGAGSGGGGDALNAVAEAALKGPHRSSHHPHQPHQHQQHLNDVGGPSSNRGGGGVHSSTGAIVSNQMPVNRTVHRADGTDLIVLVKGDNVFGTTVSKSFVRGPPGLNTGGVDTVNISIASYRVVEFRGGNRAATTKPSGSSGGTGGSVGSSSAGGGGGSCAGSGKYAQFLVIYREGSIRDTIGVWKRYSDFEELARKVTQSHEGCKFAIANLSPLSVTEEPDVEHLPNAITSWRLLKKRQRWYRCLDAGYLSLKVFLLERFLHDILFESSSPKLLRDFVGGGGGGSGSDTLS